MNYFSGLWLLCYDYHYNSYHYSLKKLNGIWSSTQSNLPTNIFIFSSIMLSKKFQLEKNLFKWNISKTPDCEICLLPETLDITLVHTWHHNSALNFLATCFKAMHVYFLLWILRAFFPFYHNLRSTAPWLTYRNQGNGLYVLELTIGFQTNFNTLITESQRNIQPLISDLKF